MAKKSVDAVKRLAESGAVNSEKRLRPARRQGTDRQRLEAACIEAGGMRPDDVKEFVMLCRPLNRQQVRRLLDGAKTYVSNIWLGVDRPIYGTNDDLRAMMHPFVSRFLKSRALSSLSDHESDKMLLGAAAYLMDRNAYLGNDTEWSVEYLVGEFLASAGSEGQGDQADATPPAGEAVQAA